jgi:hypothetical protein
LKELLCLECPNNHCNHLYLKRKKLFEKFWDQFKEQGSFYVYLSCILNKENFENNVENISFEEFTKFKKVVKLNPEVIFENEQNINAVSTFLLNSIVKGELERKLGPGEIRNKFKQLRNSKINSSKSFNFK